MAFEKRNNEGVLFRNDRKEKETHPDWSGYIIVDGVEHWLNCWEKHGAKGLFFSLAAKPKEQRAAEIKQAAKPRYGDPGNERGRQIDDDTGEIPFAPEFR